ncbi:MAG: hypothetical protein V5A46_06785 [Haloferacaceae archaeon]
MDRRIRSLEFALAVSLLLVAATASIAVPAGAAVAGPGSAPFSEPDPATVGDPFFQTDGAEADDILLEASIEEDGDAVWTVEYRFRLTDNESRTAFEELESEIARNETPYVDRFRDRMVSTVSTAEEATGREMSVSNVTVDTRRQTLGREYGVVAYSFTWGGFAATEDDAILAGDAVAGLFLDADSQFVLAWPEGYEATSVTPDPSRSTPTTAIWDGPFEFGSDEPRIRLEPVPPGERTPTDSGTDPTDTGPTDPGDTTEPAEPSDSPVSGGVVAVLVAIAAAIGLLLFSRRRSGSSERVADDGSGPSTGPPSGVDSGGSGGSGVDADTSDSGAGGGSAATASGDSPPDELLSPEERVLKLVREHDGRIKQQEVVREMDWTDARTSQVVGSLREEGKLESFRLGRENVLKLPDEEGEDGPADR